MKTFHVSISHEVEFHDCIEVQAATEDEAISLAKEQFQCDWERSRLQEVVIHEVTEEEGDGSRDDTPKVSQSN